MPAVQGAPNFSTYKQYQKSHNQYIELWLNPTKADLPPIAPNNIELLLVLTDRLTCCKQQGHNLTCRLVLYHQFLLCILDMDQIIEGFAKLHLWHHCKLLR